MKNQLRRGARVVVSTDGPESFRGTVVSAGPWLLVLADFEVISSAGSQPADGRARIPRRTITWIQEL